MKCGFSRWGDRSPRRTVGIFIRHPCQAPSHWILVDVPDELREFVGVTNATHDQARSETMTVFVALVYNWSSLFVRLTNPTQRAQAITSRPSYCTPSVARPVTAINPS